MFIIEIKADKKTGVSNYQVAEQLSTLSYLTDHFNFYNISLHCPCKIFLHNSSHFPIYDFDTLHLMAWDVVSV